MSTAHADESLYGLLEVNPNATFAEIEIAYERIMGYLGVDSIALYSMLDDPDEVDRQRARVEDAFRILGDPQRRAAYDTARLGKGKGADYPSIVVPVSPADSGGASMTFGRFDAPDTEPSGTELPANSDAPSQTVPPEPAGSVDVAAPGRDTRAVAPPESTPAPEPEASRPAPAVAEPSPPAITPAPQPKILAVEPREKIRRLYPDVDGPNLTADTEISGGLLKRLRESCGASVAEVASITKISKRYLRALEQNDYASLPAAVYIRGFVREYARVLGLDGDAVARGYMSLYERYKTGGDESCD